MNTVIMIILVALATILSISLVWKQKSDDVKAHKLPPNGGDRSLSQPVAASSSKEAQQKQQQADDEELFKAGLIEVTFNEIVFAHSPDTPTVLSKVTGKIPAGSITGILGPTAW